MRFVLSVFALVGLLACEKKVETAPVEVTPTTEALVQGEVVAPAATVVPPAVADTPLPAAVPTTPTTEKVVPTPTTGPLSDKS